MEKVPGMITAEETIGIGISIVQKKTETVIRGEREIDIVMIGRTGTVKIKKTGTGKIERIGIASKGMTVGETRDRGDLGVGRDSEAEVGHLEDLSIGVGDRAAGRGAERVSRRDMTVPAIKSHSWKN